MQLVMPAIFVAYFWRQGDRHANGGALVGRPDLWNVSVYVQDARAEELRRGRGDTTGIPPRDSGPEPDQLSARRAGGRRAAVRVVLPARCLRWRASRANVA